MRRILLAVMSTVAAVVLLFGYRTSTPNPVDARPNSVVAGSADPGSAGGGGTATTPAAPPRSSSPSSTAGTASTPKTVSGQAVQTRWGPVQVQITVSANKVTAVNVLQVPAGNSRDVQINRYAVPVLMQETLQAQDAGIDAVSGATVTSEGYIASLQSALDRAGR